MAQEPTSDPALHNAWQKHMRQARLAFMLTMGLALALFAALLYLNIPSDIPMHAKDVQSFVEGGSLPGHFLYFLLVAVLSGWSSNMWVLLIVAYTVVAVSVAIKLSITGHFVGNRLPIDKAHLQWWAAAALTVAFSIPVSWPEVYLGSLPPNVWHNSTTIFAMPFVVALFWQSIRYLEKPSNKLVGWMALMVLLNVLAKPNFFLSFAVAFPLLSLLQFRFSAHFWKSLLPVALGTVAIGLQYFLFFPETGNGETVGTGVEAGLKLAPFNVWAHYAQNIPLAFVGSVLFPLLWVGFYPKIALRDRPFQLAAGLFLVSLILFVLVSETGVREFHGNFGWGTLICNYVLFMSALTGWLTQLPARNNWTLKDKLTAAAFALHVLAGLFYLAKFLIAGSYF